MRSKRLCDRARRNDRFFSDEVCSARPSSSTRLWKPVSSATSNGVTLRLFGTQSEFPEAIHPFFDLEQLAEFAEPKKVLRLVNG